jgi:dTDP-4-amino-4,6-dideoxygalactose transaminase
MLALYGGTPVLKNQIPAWPQATDIDRQMLTDTILAGNYKSGKLREQFEATFAADCGVAHCFAVANGTVSLELILRGFGIGKGDEVILPPYTFIATLSSIVFAGATPVLADIDDGNYLLSPASVEEKITDKTRAIVAVAVGGCPPDLDALEEIAQRHNVKLIVDAAQGVGAEWKGKNLCAYGDAASISCQNSKNLTSGEGGIITTNDDVLAKKLELMLSGGKEDGKYVSVAQDHRITELQASVLLSQYAKLSREIVLRDKNAAYLAGRLKGLGFVEHLAYDDRITTHAYHLFLMRFKKEELAKKGITRDQFIKALVAEGVPICSGYAPLYTFPCVTSLDTERMIGTKIDTTPLSVCERASYEEGSWMGQAVLLSDRATLDAIVEAIIKVWEHADELKNA